MIRKVNWWLVGILVVAALLRVVGLDRVPPELFGDEVDLGYHAYSLWKTGRDTNGHFLPFYVESLSEWKAPFAMYVTAPFVGVLGLSEWGVRLPFAFAGVMGVYLMYFLGKKLLASETVALVAAGMMAISPWHLQYSRGAWEAGLLLTLVLLGTALAVVGRENSGRRRWWVGAVVVFGLALYTYNTANVFVPLLGLGLVVGWKGEIFKQKKAWLLPLLVGIVLVAPLVKNVISGHAAERYKHFSVFLDESIVDETNRKRLVDDEAMVARLAHNKLVGWGRRLALNYSIAFSPQFLFIDGDITMRHSIHEIGEFFWWELPALIVGCYFLAKKRPSKLSWILWWWLVIAPIPASLTRDGAGHATRLLLLLPALVWVGAYGAVRGSEALRRRWGKGLRNAILVGVVLVGVAEMGLYLHRYLLHYPRESWRWWHYGYKQVMQAVAKYAPDYETVYINNTYEPALLRFIFWTEVDPAVFHREYHDQEMVGDIRPKFNGFSFGDKYYFGTTAEDAGGRKYEVSEVVGKGELYLVSQRDEVAGDWDWREAPPAGIEVLETVANLEGEPIFYLVTRE